GPTQPRTGYDQGANARDPRPTAPAAPRIARRQLLGAAGRLALGGGCVGLFAACERSPVSSAGERRTARIGFLAFGPAPLEGSENYTAFVRGLNERVVVEGQNIVIERRISPPDEDRFPALVAELLALPVQVIVASGS